MQYRRCVCVYVCLIRRISGKKLTQDSKDDDDIYLHCAQSTRHPMKNIIVPCTRLLPLILVICYLTNSVLVECKVPVGNSWTPNVADKDCKFINSKRLGYILNVHYCTIKIIKICMRTRYTFVNVEIFAHIILSETSTTVYMQSIIFPILVVGRF